jgi:hypothetical protein
VNYLYNAWQGERQVYDPAASLVFAVPSLRTAGSFQKETNMASEKVRVIAFDTVDLDDNDWDGPHPHGEFLTYTSKHAAASIRVTKGGKVVIDGDYGAKKTVTIDDDVIHLPEGIGKEI